MNQSILKNFKRIVVIITLMMIFVNFLGSEVQALPIPNPQNDPAYQQKVDNILNPDRNSDPIGNAAAEIQEIIANILGGVVGFFTWGYRLFAVICAIVLSTFTSIIALVDGSVDGTVQVSPYDIFFNNINILDINFFDLNPKGEVIKAIRETIAVWYYALRFLALAILLCILIYVGIKMAISTIASEQAQYKKMLLDWCCSIALIFVLHYVILSVIYLNNALVEAIKDGVTNNIYLDSILKMAGESLGLDIYSIAATIILVLLTWQTFGFFVVYFNRMLKIGFLIIISPLITITYSIDKMGDGKAQALNNWFKEFMFTILIQPFHCIMYIALVQTGMNLIAENQGTIADRLMSSLVAVVLVNFLKKGEGIVRRIFGFKDDNNKTSLAKAVVQTNIALNAIKGAGKNTKKAIGNAKTGIDKMKNIKRDISIQTVAAAHYLKNKDSESYEKEVEDATVDYYKKRSDKLKLPSDTAAKRLKEKIEDAQGDKKYVDANEKDAVEKLTSAIMQKNDGAISERVARQQATYEYRKKRAKLTNNKNKNKSIGKFVGSKIKRNKQNNPNPGDINYDGDTHQSTKNVLNKLADSKFVNGVGDMVKNVKEPLLEMPTDLLKKYASGGIAAFSGIGAYSQGKSTIESAMLGLAIKGEFDELFGGLDRKSTKEIDKIVREKGCQTGLEAKRAIDKVENASDNYDQSNKKAQKKLDGLVNDLISRARTILGASVSEIQLTNLSNKIHDNVVSNPNDLQKLLEEEIKNITNGDENKAKEIQSLEQYSKLSSYGSDVALFTAIQNLKASDVDLDKYVEKLMKDIDKKAMDSDILYDDIERAVRADNMTEAASEIINKEKDKEEKVNIDLVKEYREKYVEAAESRIAMLLENQRRKKVNELSNETVYSADELLSDDIELVYARQILDMEKILREKLSENDKDFKNVPSYKDFNIEVLIKEKRRRDKENGGE